MIALQKCNGCKKAHGYFSQDLGYVCGYCGFNNEINNAQMQKTAEDVQIGDVIIYESLGYDRREIRVTSVSKDIKNNRAGFDGVTVDGNESVWGYCSQIVKFVSHAENDTEICGKCGYQMEAIKGKIEFPHKDYPVFICGDCKGE